MQKRKKIISLLEAVYNDVGFEITLSSVEDEDYYEIIVKNGHYCTYFYSDNLLDYINYIGYDWLNAHHFDYRELIPMGLAIDATGLNIY